MWFNSVEFFLFFLPLSLAATIALRRLAPMPVLIGFFVVLSLVFYGWNEPLLVLLLAGTIAVNYGFGRVVGNPALAERRRRLALIFGIAANLLCLGVFKYADFAVANVNRLLGTDFAAPGLPLPMGVSFYIFLEVAYLVDCYRAADCERDLGRFSFFVTYYPHLVAGPILRQGDIMPQLSAGALGRPTQQDLASGLAYLALGLFKKTVLADNVAPISDAVFGASPAALGPIAAWIGTVAFALQIYFDFSAYSDIAIGTSRCLGIRLPFNFNSPYKAASISDFWRRWHMTLSLWLRDYLYIPLGGNRCGAVRHAANLMIVMLLAGLWHGAGWTFVIWGGLHGAYLVIGHRLRALGWNGPWASAASRAATLIAVLVAWVFFRAANLDQALEIVGRMGAFDGFGRVSADLALIAQAAALPVGGAIVATAVLALFALTMILPNTQEIVGGLERSARQAADAARAWLQPTLLHAAVLGGLFGAALLAIPRTSVFIYFRF